MPGYWSSLTQSSTTHFYYFCSWPCLRWYNMAHIDIDDVDGWSWPSPTTKWLLEWGPLVESEESRAGNCARCGLAIEIGDIQQVPPDNPQPQSPQGDLEVEWEQIVDAHNRVGLALLSRNTAPESALRAWRHIAHYLLGVHNKIEKERSDD